KWAPFIFSIVSLGAIVSYFMDALPGSAVIIWLLIGLGITGTYLKQVNKISSETDGIRNTFRQLQKLILQIEQTHFSSELLRLKQKEVLLNKNKSPCSPRSFRIF